MFNNRKRLIGVIKQAHITQREAAQRIAQFAQTSCSLRTLQAWVADPLLAGARTCSGWAVLALECSLAVLPRSGQTRHRLSGRRSQRVSLRCRR